jgi:hypothetical protein
MNLIFDDIAEYALLLRQALRKYGKTIQLIMVIEEIAELTKEITKYFRGKNSRENIIEEVGDVYIMLDQMRIIFNITDEELEITMNNKMKRLEDLLKAEEEE